MDIVEFTEKCMNVKLAEWQKPHLRKLYELTRDNNVRIVMGKGGRVYTYLTPKTLKELTQNVTAIDSSR